MGRAKMRFIKPAAALLALAVPAASTGAASAPLQGPTSPYRANVEIVLMSATMKPASVRIEARALSANSLVKRTLFVARSNRPNAIPLSEGLFQIHVVGDGTWASDQFVEVTGAAPEKDVRLELWPAAVVSGVFLGLGKDGPAEFELAIQTPSENTSRSIKRSARPCPIYEDGAFACAVPATVLDLELRVRGFVGERRFDVQTEPSKKSDLGTLTLRRGPSVEGFVRHWDGSSGASASISLSGVDVEGIKKATSSGAANRRGFYQLVGIPSGMLEIKARLGSAQARDRLIVEGQSQVLAPPLRLEMAHTLEIRVEPDLDSVGRPWKVEVLDTGNQMESSPVQWEKESKRWRAPGLARSTYLVQVSDSKGERWSIQSADVPDSTSLVIQIAPLRVRGRVSWGQKPLEADLTFGGEFGSLRASMRSTPEGTFEGRLPGRPDASRLWTVLVTSDEPKMRRIIPGVRLVEEGDDYVVEIEIPGTELRGRVRDENGDPVAALISVQSLDKVDREQKAYADAAGNYSVAGVDPGEAIVRADYRDRSSSPQTLNLKAEGRPHRLDLVLNKRHSRSGRVVDAQGQGILEALVVAQPVGIGHLWGPVQTTSRRDGIFDLSFPNTVSSAAVLAGAPGYALTPGVSEGMEPTEIVLQPVGGELTLNYERILSVMFYMTPAAYLISGRYIELIDNGLLRSWALTNLTSLAGEAASSLRFVDRPGPTSMVVPRMAPGNYALCALMPQEKMGFVRTGVLPEKGCSFGYLNFGGSLGLRAPAR